MEIAMVQTDQVTVVSVIGSIDALTADELGDHLQKQIDAGFNRLVLDLAQVDFMSSAGLRIIIKNLKIARQVGGDFHIAAAQPAVENMLNISGFTSIVKSYSSVEEAIADFTAR